jgi:hypothetical protein
MDETKTAAKRADVDETPGVWANEERAATQEHARGGRGGTHDRAPDEEGGLTEG